MKRTLMGFAGFLAISSAGLSVTIMGCSAQQQAPETAFVVSEPNAEGLVTVIANPGLAEASSQVSLMNLGLGASHKVAAGSSGAVMARFVAKSEDTINVAYRSVSGSDETEEVAPEQGLVAAHGLLTMNDSDGPEGPNQPCFILVRDDLAVGSSEPAELLLFPGKKGCKPPPQDGQQPPPEGQQPPQDGQQPPQDGQQPPPNCGCPPPPPPEDGSDASPPPNGGQCQPPPEGGQPPKEGEQPPQGGNPQQGKPPIEQYVGQNITVIGIPRDQAPPMLEDSGCAGAPFEVRALAPDEAASGEPLNGKLETVSVSSSSSTKICQTFLWLDVVNESGEQSVDFQQRFELVGDLADELLSSGLEDGTSLTLSGVIFQGPTLCGFTGLTVTSWELDGAASSSTSDSAKRLTL